MYFGPSLGFIPGESVYEKLSVYNGLIRNLGFDAIELRLPNNHNNYISNELFGAESNKINSLTNQYRSVGFHLPSYKLNFLSYNEFNLQLNEIIVLLKSVSRIKLDYLVFHGKSVLKNSMDLDLFKKWVELISVINNVCLSNNVKLYIENADDLINLNILALIVKKINSKNLRIMLDLGHAHFRIRRLWHHYPMRFLDIYSKKIILTRGMPFDKYGSLTAFIQAENQYIGGIHLHDYNGREDHLNLGDGKIDFTFLKQTKDLIQDIPIIFESQMKHPQEDLQRNFNQLKDIICK